MSRKLARHACADTMYDQRGYSVGDTIFCECRRLYTLTSRSTITFRQMVTSWLRPLVPSVESDKVAWIRNLAAERADHRERVLREREWRRG